MTCFAIGEIFAKLLKSRPRVGENRQTESKPAAKVVCFGWSVTPASFFIRRIATH